MPWYVEWLLLYLCFINITGIIVTVHDKIAAKRNRWRVSEKTLFILSALGAAVSVYLTMLIIRHKTKHKRFMIGIPAIIFAELLIVIALYIWVI